MPADIKVGNRYLTVSGRPVQVTAFAGETMLLQSLVSDNLISVPAGYPLYPMKQREPAFETRTNPYSRRPKGAAINGQMKPVKQLAPFIDAMLLTGGKTMTGILREIRRKASASCKGKDLAANVRARLYWLKRKGYRLEKIGQDLRLIPPAPVASQ